GRPVVLLRFQVEDAVPHVEGQDVRLHSGEGAGRFGGQGRPTVLVERRPERVPLLRRDRCQVDRFDRTERADERLEGRLHVAEDLGSKVGGNERVRLRLEYDLPAVRLAGLRVEGRGRGCGCSGYSEDDGGDCEVPSHRAALSPFRNRVGYCTT